MLRKRNSTANALELRFFCINLLLNPSSAGPVDLSDQNLGHHCGCRYLQQLALLSYQQAQLRQNGRHFQMHFLEWKSLYSYENFIEISSQGTN